MMSINKKEALLAQDGRRLLDGRGVTVEIVPGKGAGTKVELPRTAVRALIEALGYISQGQNVTVQPVVEELSTQKAAEMLKVSRPYLIKLLDSGELPFRKVGKHRRIRSSDLVSYKEAIDAKRLDALRELSAQAQELGMGY